LQEVRWRLRHTSESSFARYIQEAGAALVIGRFTAESRRRVRLFASGTVELLRSVPVKSGQTRCPLFPQWS
jgi:hypothetical protein